MDHCVADDRDGFHLKLWRGESMCLVGMDVDDPEDDLVGFSIRSRRPGDDDFTTLHNRLRFDQPDGVPVSGRRDFPSTEAPFQKFRWVHFPWDPVPGTYRYEVTKLHMPRDGELVRGTQLELDISLDPVTYDGFLDVGFTRNFASSQAYRDKFGNRDDILPATVDEGLQFEKPAGSEEVYRWLGFEGARLVFGMLDEAAGDPEVRLDVLAYDLNESAIVERLERMGDRLRVVIDSSDNHVTDESSEQRAAARLVASAGTDNVRRTRFGNLQHHKVLIASRRGEPYAVLIGSTNFSYRGLYIQANNALRFDCASMAGLFRDMFQQAFDGPDGFSASDLSRRWHLVETNGRPSVQVCLSPHRHPELALSPVGAAIDQATSSVLYSIAFLNQIRSGAVQEALERLIDRPVFSYGAVDKVGGMEVHKPDGSIGLVDFGYLAQHAPAPFGREWQAGKGINIHNKFVVTDFSLPSAKVFTGSSNLSPSGERSNGDHLVMIEDPRVATVFAIEAVRLFDHLQFRTAMQAVDRRAAGAPTRLTLAKPTAVSGRPAWFEKFYKDGSQRMRDRLLFGR